MFTAPRPVRKCEVRTLGDFVPFPTQDDNFPACPAEEDISLREDIAATGLRDLIHILPDNAAGLPPDTILFGHRRCRALRELGHTEYRVWVRYDLASLSYAELERLFLADNFQRRQLSKLAKARIAVRLFEIERNRKPGELRESEEREARDRVGKAIGMSGRSLQRYLNIARAPISLQVVFDQGKITLIEADRLACLPPRMLEEVDQLLQSGTCPKKMLKQYPGLRSRAAKQPRDSRLKQFMRSVGEICGAIVDVDVVLTPESIQHGDLQSIIKLHDCLTSILQRLQPKLPVKKQWPGVRYVGHGRPQTT